MESFKITGSNPDIDLDEDMFGAEDLSNREAKTGRPVFNEDYFATDFIANHAVENAGYISQVNEILDEIESVERSQGLALKSVEKRKKQFFDYKIIAAITFIVVVVVGLFLATRNNMLPFGGEILFICTILIAFRIVKVAVQDIISQKIYEGKIYQRYATTMNLETEAKLTNLHTANIRRITDIKRPYFKLKRKLEKGEEAMTDEDFALLGRNIRRELGLAIKEPNFMPCDITFRDLIIYKRGYKKVK